MMPRVVPIVLAARLVAAGVAQAERLAVKMPKANVRPIFCFPQPHPRRTE